MRARVRPLMSTKADEANLWLRVRRWFQEQIARQLMEVWYKILEFKRNPRQMIEEMKRSKMMRRFIIALLLGEMVGAFATGFSLLVITRITAIIPFAGTLHLQNLADVGGALALNYHIANVAFYVAWIILGYERYCSNGFGLAIVDLALFNGLDMPVKWLAIAFEGALASLLLLAGFSKGFSVCVPYIVNILPATFIFALLCLPVITASQTKRVLAQALRKNVSAFLTEAEWACRVAKLLIQRFAHKALMIELCEWIRLYCIQTRAGPGNRPAMFAGLFLIC